MFGNADFIAATRKFVCVRIDTYESEANEKLVRELMDGRLVNTTFCLFAPDGSKQLSGVGRSVAGPFASASGLDRESRRYTPAGDLQQAMVPDFHSCRSAMNVAAADGRPLVVVVAPASDMAEAEQWMRQVAWHADVVGRFHFDLETDVEAIRKRLPGDDAKLINQSGVYVIHPDAFGLEGKVIRHIDIDANKADMRGELLNALDQYAKDAQPKTYESHVAEGKRHGIYLEMPIAYGEDRDADGKIDGNHAARFRRLRDNAKRSGKLIPVE